MDGFTAVSRKLLRTLAAGDPVSGAELARELGITRAAVWKHIAALRASGLPIHGKPRVGYQLDMPLQLLDETLLMSHLDALDIPPLRIYDTVESTQNILLEHASSWPDLSFVLAETQTAARGRRGKSWAAPLGYNLYVSCLKHFDQGFADLAGLSLASGVCLVQALATMGAESMGLKWPNDVVTDHGKLAGILIELRGEYQGPCHAVIGIGLNLHLPASMRTRLGRPVTDLHALLGASMPERNRVAAIIITHLVHGLRTFEKQGFAAFQSAFAEWDALYDKHIQMQQGKETVSGIGRGVSVRGALKLATDNGFCELINGRIIDYR